MNKYFKFIFLTIFSIFLGLTNLTAQTENADATQTKIRVALMTVKTTSVGEGMDAAQFGAGVQNSLSEYLKTPDIELVQIEAKLPSAIEAEIKEKKVDYVVYLTAAHKKGGGGGFGKMFGKVAPMIGQVVPMAGGVGGAIAGQVASTAIMTAGSMAGNVKAKDSLEFNLTIQKTGSNAAILTKKYATKSKSNGEDIFTPLIEQMAQDTIDTANGKTVKPATEGK